MNTIPYTVHELDPTSSTSAYYIHYTRHKNLPAVITKDELNTIIIKLGELIMKTSALFNPNLFVSTMQKKTHLKIPKITEFTTEHGTSCVTHYEYLVLKFIYHNTFTVKILSLSPDRLVFYLKYLKQKNRIKELCWVCNFLSVVFMKTSLLDSALQYKFKEPFDFDEDSALIRYVSDNIRLESLNETETKEDMISMKFNYFETYFDSNKFQNILKEGKAEGEQYIARVLSYITSDIEMIQHLMNEEFDPSSFSHFSTNYLNDLVQNQHNIYNLSFVILNNKRKDNNTYSKRFRSIKTSNNKFLTIEYDYNADNQASNVDKSDSTKQNVKVTTYGGFSKIVLPTEPMRDTAMDIEKEMQISDNCFILGYGCSGAGKTYTLIGESLDSSGLIVELCSRIMNTMSKSKSKSNIEGKREKPIIHLWMSEFYKDVVREKSVIIEKPIDDLKQLHETLYEGFKTNREVSKTDHNSESSRSHCLAIIRFSLGTWVKNIIVGDYAGVEPESKFTFTMPSLQMMNDWVKKINSQDQEAFFQSVDEFNTAKYDSLLKLSEKKNAENQRMEYTVFQIPEKTGMESEVQSNVSSDPLFRAMLLQDRKFTSRMNISGTGLAKRIEEMMIEKEHYRTWKKINDEAISINNSLNYLKRDLKEISEQRKKKLFGKIYISNIAQECFDTYFHDDPQPTEKSLQRPLPISMKDTVTFQYIRSILKDTNVSTILPCLLCVVNISIDMDQKLLNPYTVITGKPRRESTMNEKSMIGSLEFADKFSKLFSIPNTCHSRIKDEVNIDREKEGVEKEAFDRKIVEKSQKEEELRRKTDSVRKEQSIMEEKAKKIEEERKQKEKDRRRKKQAQEQATKAKEELEKQATKEKRNATSLKRQSFNTRSK